MFDRRALTAVFVAAASLSLTVNPARAEGSAGPSAADRRIEDFLATAEVVSIEDVGEGITEPRRVQLRSDGGEARAIFKTVDIESTDPHYTSQFETNFSDRYVYEVAAYRLDRALGIGLVPVTVLRTIDGERGSLQLWIEDVISMQDAVDRDLAPRNLDLLLQRLMLMWVLDALIFNVDRNYTNILVNPAIDGFHLIDHSRSFRAFKRLPPLKEERDIPIPPAVAANLRDLDSTTLEAIFGDLLPPRLIKPILRRRDLVVKDLKKRGLLP